jgi:DNA helicase HerA-like ATPase
MAQLELPDYEERILVVGSNGSGKTVFLRALLGAGYRYWVVVDHKGGFIPPHDPDHKVTMVRDPRDRKLLTADRVLYRPSAQFKTRRWYEYLFQRLYARADAVRRNGKRFVLLVDETLAIARMRAVLWLGNIAVVGREWGVGLWLASQRLKWIPIEAKSEAWRWYLFYLSDQDDEKEALRFAKGELTLEQLRELTGGMPPPFVELRRGAESGGRVQVKAYPPVRKPPDRQPHDGR